MLWALYIVLLVCGFIFMGIGRSTEDPTYKVFGILFLAGAFGFAIYTPTPHNLTTDGARSYTVVREAYDSAKPPSFGGKQGSMLLRRNSTITMYPAAGVAGKSYKLHVNLVGKNVSLSGSTSASSGGWCFVINEGGSGVVYDQSGVKSKADTCLDGVARQTK